MSVALIVARGAQCQDSPDAQPAEVTGLVRVPIRGAGSDLLVGVHEVTWSEFDTYCNAQGLPKRARTLSGYNADGELIQFEPPGDHPATGVSRREATGYCDWVSGRLPTEAEWRSLAVSPAGAFAWGEASADQTRLNSRACDTLAASPAAARRPSDGEPGWSDGFPFTSPVGQFPAGASQAGLHDLCGNVWEWVSSKSGFVLVGGGWTTRPGDCTSSSRLEFPDDQQGVVDFGFRVVRDIH